MTGFNWIKKVMTVVSNFNFEMSSIQKCNLLRIGNSSQLGHIQEKYF